MVICTGYVPSVCPGINCWGDGKHTYYGAHPGPHVAGCGWYWREGTRLFVPGYGVTECLDRGSGISDTGIDLLFATEAEAFRWGRRRVRVIVLTPMSGEIE